MRIAMIGTGYVGLVSGACLSDFGHEVVAYDNDPDKIARINRGEDAADARAVAHEGVRRVAAVPFDHDRRMSSVLVDDPTAGRLLVTKVRPNRCSQSPARSTTSRAACSTPSSPPAGASSRWRAARRPSSKP